MPNETRKLTGDEYMALLVKRQEAWMAAHPVREGGPVRVRPHFPPLYEWFIRDGDEELVDLDAVKAMRTERVDG